MVLRLKARGGEELCQEIKEIILIWMGGGRGEAGKGEACLAYSHKHKLFF